MKKVISCLLMVIMLFLSATACADSQDSNAVGDSVNNDELSVVTTIFPPYDFVNQITGGKANIHLLLSPGSESHDYEPTPNDIIKIKNSDLFIYIGGENDIWVDDILKSMNTESMTILRLMDYVELKEEETVEGMTELHEHEHDEHGHEIEYDEHIWTSPENAKIMLNEISKKLQKINPEKADEYQKNTTSYEGEITKLQSSIKTVVDKAENKTIIFADRFPFKYFADEFGLKYYAAFPGCGSDTEPSAATLAFLINKVKSKKIPAIYYVEFSSRKIADTICSETGVNALLFHSCHNVSAEDLSNNVTYVSIMTQNLENLKVGLSVE